MCNKYYVLSCWCKYVFCLCRYLAYNMYNCESLFDKLLQNGSNGNSTQNFVEQTYLNEDLVKHEPLDNVEHSKYHTFAQGSDIKSENGYKYNNLTQNRAMNYGDHTHDSYSQDSNYSSNDSLGNTDFTHNEKLRPSEGALDTNALSQGIYDTQGTCKDEEDDDTTYMGFNSKDESAMYGMNPIGYHTHLDQNALNDFSQAYGRKDMESDTYLPIANIGRLMKSVLPPNAKIAKQAKDMIRECVTEFILFISSEASELCSLERRKTLTGEDILLAMNRLGFEHYDKPLKLYHSKWREMKDQGVSVAQCTSFRY
ncbi:hypothetical protein BEWA_044890 [Theileria equi strain WA]|uniref:Transcription factor CBF/NF-Y/archaeal histone domain-containing protein n=1 Tax=Theileria equi strain WA TaxID=1537102 RepID=L1LGK1_THEEQ|nr:hypothetical protein BEWA_044890 [Theileria equi strain WA]EKX74409.1 hypothetical protein BEWA_044890 [Theileria equi strain WA]|eukprot:XP_004833861.1 hypothetical protein BEWA_044890 [Theileria equi strain WA]